MTKTVHKALPRGGGVNGVVRWGSIVWQGFVWEWLGSGGWRLVGWGGGSRDGGLEVEFLGAIR